MPQVGVRNKSPTHDRQAGGLIDGFTSSELELARTEGQKGLKPVRLTDSYTK